MSIARLIADPAQNPSDLEEQLLTALNAAVSIRALGGGASGTLFEVIAEGASQAQLRDGLETLDGLGDFLTADAAITTPNLFISDMDSTMIGQECIDELADYAGLKPQIAAITERAMQGELDFESALRERVGLLANLDESAIARCLDERIAPMAGAATLVATLKAKGCRTVLVTGGFHHFADPVAAQLGFDHVVGNRLAVENGRLTGGLAGPVVDSSVKRATLEAEMAGLGADAVSLASGDGANDIPMLEAADYGFAYHAKPKARAAANGVVAKGDLTAILTLLGIAEGEWVRA